MLEGRGGEVVCPFHVYTIIKRQKNLNFTDERNFLGKDYEVMSLEFSHLQHILEARYEKS